MAEITASLIKTLREKTGAGMMDCKKALHEMAGDLEAAIDWLRKKGLAAAQKKAGRVAAEGLVGVASRGKAAGIVEVNAETDFIAKNTDFQALVKACAELVSLEDLSLESLAGKPFSGESATVGEELTRLISVIGENMNLRRAAHMEVSDGVVSSYIHSQAAPGLGRIGVLVALESTGDKAKLEDLGRKVAMHVAAAMPQALNRDEVDPAAIERERNIFMEQARESGRSEEIIEKMVEGRLRKFYEEVCLEEQLFIMDGKSRVMDVVSEAAKEIGAEVKMKGFIRFTLGEGIEKEVSDFAAEVQAQANK